MRDHGCRFSQRGADSGDGVVVGNYSLLGPWFSIRNWQTHHGATDLFKPKVERFAALNAKYKMTGMYHTYSGEGMVGAAIWDLLYVLKNFDPAQVDFTTISAT